MRILVLNAGSSSLKASLVDAGEALVRTTVGWGSDATREADRGAGIASVLEAVEEAGIGRDTIAGVGHRVVHGGPKLTAPTLIDADVLSAIDRVGDLAPLHNIVALETIRAAQSALPDLPQVACFDTGFHATMPETIRRYPVPESWYRDWGVRRYGFHGLSVAWATTRAGELQGRPVEELRLVVAHLGSGCSVTAVDGGRSVATSMGLTPLEGLMMGSRAGSVDPGIPLYLLRTGRLGLEELTEALDHESGLLGVSGRTSDVRQLEAASADGDEAAARALEMFAERAAAAIAAAATSLPRLDAVVFTGGIGEHAGRVRAAIVARLGVLGIGPIGPEETGVDRILAPAARSSGQPGRPADTVPAAPVVLRVEAREDLVIARETERTLSSRA
jgi:acetate kinase